MFENSLSLTRHLVKLLKGSYIITKVKQQSRTGLGPKTHHHQKEAAHSYRKQVRKKKKKRNRTTQNSVSYWESQSIDLLGGFVATSQFDFSIV